MATDVVPLLPPDLFHLITAELAAKALQADSQEAARPEFAALYNCVLSSKYLAGAGALSALYRYIPNDALDLPAHQLLMVMSFQYKSS